METVVSSKGQVVIPSALRRKYDIKKGTKVEVTDRDGRIVLEPVTAGRSAGCAAFSKAHGRSKT